MRICACGCGRDLDGLRADAVYKTDACRQKAFKSRQRRPQACPVPVFEPQVVALIAACEVSPEAGLLAVVFPDVLQSGRELVAA